MKEFSLLELKSLPTSFFEKNRKNYIKNLKIRLTELEEDSILMLKGGVPLPRYDNDTDLHYFIQESNFYYLTGVREGNFYASIDLKNDGDLTLFVTLPDEKTKIFFHVETLEDIRKKYNAVDAVDKMKMSSVIKSRNPKKIYILNGVNSDSGSKILSFDLEFPAPYSELNSIKDNNGLIYEILADTRTIKTDEEIEIIKKLDEITVDAHINAIKNIKEGLKERDIENLFWGEFIKITHCRNHPYELICGCGINSGTLHYIENTNNLKNGQLILMDVGTTSCHYNSDVTSTVPVSGKFTSEQKEIYDIVLEANRSCQKIIKAGINWVDVHLNAEKVIITGLKKLGLLNDFSVEEMVDKRVCYYFMPHGVGHLLGLDVHDVGGYLSYTQERSELPGLSLLRSSRTLSANCITTVEPGIYFIPFLLKKAFDDNEINKYFNKKKIENYYEFGGVRIEDDVLVTIDGCINLTENLPRETELIEELMGNK